jgi:hypothetical protein
MCRRSRFIAGPRGFRFVMTKSALSMWKGFTASLAHAIKYGRVFARGWHRGARQIALYYPLENVVLVGIESDDEDDVYVVVYWQPAGGVKGRLRELLQEYLSRGQHNPTGV